MKYQPRRQFSLAFKEEAVRRSVASAHRIQDVARELGIHPGVLYRWRRDCARYGQIGRHAVNQKDPPAPPKSYKDLERENRRLKRELERSRTDAAILKKAQQYFTNGQR